MRRLQSRYEAVRLGNRTYRVGRDYEFEKFTISNCTMELKDYQQQALDTLDRYLEALKEARQKADEFSTINIDELPPIVREQSAALARAATDYPLAAWESLREASVLPSITDAQGQGLDSRPHSALRVPLVNPFRTSA